MKVYVVEVGVYSDRSVVGVTETKTEAKRVCELLDDDSAHYTEFDTGQFRFGEKIKFRVNLYTGKAVYSDWLDNINKNTRLYEGNYVIFAETPELALKIASDMEAEWQAEKEGI